MNKSDNIKIVIEQANWGVSVSFNGQVIADTTQAILFYEGERAAVYYFPRNDVRMDLCNKTLHETHCRHKGEASYWDITVGKKYVENALWSYEEPLAGASKIKDYIAFYMDKLGTTYIENR